MAVTDDGQTEANRFVGDGEDVFPTYGDLCGGDALLPDMRVVLLERDLVAVDGDRRVGRE